MSLIMWLMLFNTYIYIYISKWCSVNLSGWMEHVTCWYNFNLSGWMEHVTCWYNFNLSGWMEHVTCWYNFKGYLIKMLTPFYLFWWGDDPLEFNGQRMKSIRGQGQSLPRYTLVLLHTCYVGQCNVRCRNYKNSPCLSINCKMNIIRQSIIWIYFSLI